MLTVMKMSSSALGSGTSIITTTTTTRDRGQQVAVLEQELQPTAHGSATARERA